MIYHCPKGPRSSHTHLWRKSGLFAILRKHCAGFRRNKPVRVAVIEVAYWPDDYLIKQQACPWCYSGEQACCECYKVKLFTYSMQVQARPGSMLPDRCTLHVP